MFPHTVKIAFLDVGQGDSIVVTVPDTGEAIIVDCPEADTVIEYLQAEEIRFIRALVITHLHLDHFRDTVGFLEHCSRHLGIPCERLLFNWPNRQPLLPDSDAHGEHPNPAYRNRARLTAYQELMAWVDQPANDAICSGLVRPRQNEFLDIDGTITAAIKILQPSHAQLGGLMQHGVNNTSAILRVEGPGASALLTADLEPAGWLKLQQRHKQLQSEVLKFPHHGAWKDADPHDILDVVAPSLVVISVGADGTRYNHPNLAVFKAIRDRPATQLLCTQVTNRCVDNPATCEHTIDQILKADAAARGMRHIRTARGCPCAGTIIIELGDQVRVLHPERSAHQDQIIKRHFHTHQCAL